MTDPARGLSTITVGGGSIEYLELPAAVSRDLAPLVLLHEGLGSVRLWRSFPEEVARATGRRTVVFSRHGYGGSAVVTAPRDVDYMHREATSVLPAVLDRLQVEAPVLLGHSDGASIALIAAGSGALEATALVLLAPHVVVEDLSIEGIRAAREAFLTTNLAERMAAYHTDAEATFWGWNDIWLSPAFRGWDIRDHLPGVTCPVLAIQGLQDQYGTLAQLDLVEAGIDGPLRRVELDGCRHSPHLDQPQATVDAVAAFLAGLP